MQNHDYELRNTHKAKVSTDSKPRKEVILKFSTQCEERQFENIDCRALCFAKPSIISKRGFSVPKFTTPQGLMLVVADFAVRTQQLGL